MTDVIKRISQIKAKVDNQNTANTPRTISQSTNTNTSKTVSTNTTSTTSSQQQTVKPKQFAAQATAAANSSNGASNSGFCGMKKGFLSGGLDTSKKPSAASPNTNKVATSASCDNIPHIKANPGKPVDNSVIQEVQKMRDQLQKTGKIF